MNLQKVKNNSKAGTPGPWESLGGYTIHGGVPHKKSTLAYKNKVCEVTAHDLMIGALDAKERKANIERIENLPELEASYLEAVKLLSLMVKKGDDETIQKAKAFLQGVN